MENNETLGWKRYWIFQANPERYDLAKNLKAGVSDAWSLSRFKEQVQEGDIALFWSSGEKSGLYGWGVVESIRKGPQKKGLNSKLDDVICNVKYEVAFKKFLPKDFFLTDKANLHSLTILRNSQGTNFRVSTLEAKAICQLIETKGEHTPELPISDDSERFSGKALNDYSYSATPARALNAVVKVAIESGNYTVFNKLLTQVLFSLALHTDDKIPDSTRFLREAIHIKAMPLPFTEGIEWSTITPKLNENELLQVGVKASVLYLLSSARRVAIMTNSKQLIELRHFIAAILCGTTEKQSDYIKELLSFSDASIESIKERFLDYLYENHSEDNLDAWKKFISETPTSDISSGQDDSEEIEKNIIQKQIVPIGDMSSEKDLLGRKRLVHVLKGIIKYTDSVNSFRPFVIGLFGEWGSGKSTVIKLLRDSFKANKRYCFLEFNAWQNEHCKNMGAALAHSLINEFYEGRSMLSRIHLAFKYKILLNNDIFVISSFLIAIILIPTLLFTDYGKVFNLQQYGVTDYVTPFLLALFAAGKSYWQHPFTTKVNELIKKPDYSSHLGVAQQMKQEIDALLKAHSLKWHAFMFEAWNITIDKFLINVFAKVNESKKYSKQFIVVVDDLDRCSDAKILEVLEAIRLIVDLDNVIVFLAVDKKILLNAVANKYEKQNSHLSQEESLIMGRKFLGKILQLTIELDVPGTEHINKFVSERLYQNLKDENKITNDIVAGKKMINESEHEFAAEFNKMIDDKTYAAMLHDNLDHYEEDFFNEVDESDEYLQHGDDETTVFSKCIGVFQESNPRTLVRIHNTITLLKGLYPNLIDEPDSLRVYIFLVFLHEVFASASKSKKLELDKVLNPGDLKSSLKEVYAMRKLSEDLGVIGVGNDEIRKAIGRIRKLSLPIAKDVKELVEDGEGRD